MRKNPPAEEMSLQGTVAVQTRIARGDSPTATLAAREALWQQYQRQVDPEGALSQEERAKRAAAARRADMARLALKSVQARRKRREAKLIEELFPEDAPHE